MCFLLTTLKVVYVISTPKPKENDNETMENQRKHFKRENDDFICRSHIFYGMVNALFDVYLFVETAKDLWDKLEAKYMVQDAYGKQFLVFILILTSLLSPDP